MNETAELDWTDVLHEAMRRHRLPNHSDAEIADIAIKALRGHGFVIKPAPKARCEARGENLGFDLRCFKDAGHSGEHVF